MEPVETQPLMERVALPWAARALGLPPPDACAMESEPTLG